MKVKLIYLDYSLIWIKVKLIYLDRFPVETDWIRLLKSPYNLRTAVGSSLGENILNFLFFQSKIVFIQVFKVTI